MAIVAPKQDTLGFPQADNRRPEFFRDQHGRSWYATVENKSGEPAESPKPFNWTAPAAPSWAAHLLVPPEDVRTIRRVRGEPLSIYLDYDTWLAKLEQRNVEFRQHAYAVARQLSGGLNVEAAMRTPDVMQQIGPSPYPAIEFVQAMVDGDAWALGLTTEVPAWAETLLTELKFQARAAGLLSTEAVRELNEADRKAMLAALQPAPAKAAGKRKATTDAGVLVGVGEG